MARAAPWAEMGCFNRVGRLEKVTLDLKFDGEHAGCIAEEFSRCLLSKTSTY